MPRRELSTARTSLVASAKNYTSVRDDRREAKVRGGEEWQRAGWEFFDTVYAYHQACTVSAALLSRATLVPLMDGRPTDNPIVHAALNELYGGPEGHSEMLRLWGLHASVAGEGWIVGPSDTRAQRTEEWQFAAATQVARAGGNWRIEGQAREDNPVMIRVWRSHPQNSRKADSPTRSILPQLAEYQQLAKRIAAQIDSRMTGAGVMLLPSETEFPAMPTQQLNAGDPPTSAIQPKGAQGFADMLMEVARIAIQNPERAEAMIPIIAMAPGEYIDKAKLLTFWSELDKAAPKLRSELVTAMAIGMDVPSEVLLGNAGSNHWNAWLSDENSVKIHGEPTAKILTTGLTRQWLWPAIEGELGLDYRRFSIAADTSQMRLRPNRSKEALELNDRLLLSDEATLRENGFTDGDLMDQEAIARGLVRKAAQGSTTPEIVEAALRFMGADLQVQITDSRPPAEARPTPSLQEHPVRELPARPTQPQAAADVTALVFAAEQMVDRALQRAGNRLKAKMALRSMPTPANRVYLAVAVDENGIDDLLQDAWTPCTEFSYGVDGAALARALDIYTRSIIIGRREPSRSGLRAALTLLLNHSAA